MSNTVPPRIVFRLPALAHFRPALFTARGFLLLVGIMLASKIPLAAVEDETVFGNHCAACHGTDGRARTPQGRKMNAKDLRESRLTDAEISRQIREGSRVKKGTSVMPAVGRDMTEPEIEAVIRIVKTFRPPESSLK